jgi:hypothetical protein
MIFCGAGHRLVACERRDRDAGAEAFESAVKTAKKAARNTCLEPVRAACRGRHFAML